MVMLDSPTSPDAEPEQQATVEIFRGMLPYEMQRAIFRTMADVGVLAKEAYNDYAGYPYASVDQFYLRIVPIALKNGLRWDLTADGQPRREANIEWWTYAVSLHYLHEPDNNNVGWTRTVTEYARIVVKHPLRGPQDTGTTISYADKAFMRQFLKIPTKEGDGDQVDNTAPPRTDEKPIEDLPNGDSRQDRRRTLRRDRWSEAINACQTAEELDQLLSRSESELQALEQNDLAAYRNVTKAVGERRAAFVRNLQGRAQAPASAVTETGIAAEVAECVTESALHNLWRSRLPDIRRLDAEGRLLKVFETRKRQLVEPPPPAAPTTSGRRVLRPPT